MAVTGWASVKAICYTLYRHSVGSVPCCSAHHPLRNDDCEFRERLIHATSRANTVPSLHDGCSTKSRITRCIRRHRLLACSGCHPLRVGYWPEPTKTPFLWSPVFRTCRRGVLASFGAECILNARWTSTCPGMLLKRQSWSGCPDASKGKFGNPKKIVGL